jgi:S-formylglutathione hydrolase FrmB
MKRFAPLVALILPCLILWPAKAGDPAVARTEPAPLQFHLTFDKKVSATPFTGRIYVMISKHEVKELPSGVNWFNPQPFLARDVRDWKPGESLTIAADALAFPQPLAKLKPDAYTVVAVMDLDQGYRNFCNAPGNGHSKPIRLHLDPAKTGTVKLVLDQIVKHRPFPEGKRVKLVEIESKLLSAFHGRSMILRAAVVLPKSFDDKPDQRYPVIYEIPGFGGDHYGAIFAQARNATEVAGVEMLYVVLDPNCRTGHHVCADSENNGPCGAALVNELIPYIEKEYRGRGVAGGRFVTGHSSGGWSSLWLQITYPDFFGGVWSTAPDPVDFRDFQRINLYKTGANMFVDEEGKQRPLARYGKKVLLYYKPFSDMETVMGHGGQLASFEAVFSPRGKDGQPRRLWDRASGRIDADVAKAWERYDIRLVLERNWKKLGPSLAGKLHVYMGGEDTFYLEGATVLLKESLAKLGSDAVVEIFPGKNHGSLMDKALRERMAKEMADVFRRQCK